MNLVIPLTLTVPLTSGVPAVTGRINRYDASDGELAPDLPLIADVPESTVVGFMKADATDNHVVVSCQGPDTIQELVTELPLTRQNQVIVFQSMNSVWWPVAGWHPLPDGEILDADSSQEVVAKTFDGTLNTFLNIPLTALATGRVIGYSGGATVIQANRGVWVGTSTEYGAIASKSASVVYVTTD